MPFKALDLFCCAGGMSEGLRRAGFEVTGVDIRDLAKYYRGGRFVQGDALSFPLEGFDYVHASPPCQSHSSLRHLHPEKSYPDLIEPIRERLKAWGGPWSIENVPGAPLGGAVLVVLCGTMFGLQTPDGRAEIRRHRLFELSFCPDRQPPACRHGGVSGEGRPGQLFGEEQAPALVLGVYGGAPQLAQHRTRDRKRREALSVTGSGLDSNRERWARRALSVTGNSPEMKLAGWTGRPARCGVTGCRRAAVLVHRSGELGYAGPDLPVCQECYDAQAEHYAAAIENREPRKVLTVTGHTPVDNTGRRVICGAGGKAMSGGMSEPQGMRKRRAMSVTGSRETFSIAEARAAMGMEEPWDKLPMKYLSQAIPPVYGEWIGRQALRYLSHRSSSPR